VKAAFAQRFALVLVFGFGNFKFYDFTHTFILW
jgi:hypothetical protein